SLRTVAPPRPEAPPVTSALLSATFILRPLLRVAGGMLIIAVHRGSGLPAAVPCCRAFPRYSLEARRQLRHALRSYGEPYGVNCCTRYPRAHAAKGIREYPSNGVVRAIHIGVDVAPVRCSI